MDTNYEKKHQEDLESAKDWLAMAKENDNKIAIQILEKFFPELKDSEDERIRKVQLDYWRSVGGKEWYGVPVQETIAWLEKQGEQKPINSQFTPEQVAILKQIDKIVEQKPTPKFKIGDTIHKIGENTVFPRTIEKIEDGDYVCNNSHSFINIKFQDDYELVEKQPSWSEEDSKNLNSVKWIIENSENLNRVFETIDSPEYIKKYFIDWLKSIKDRVQPQPKQEWSKKDEEMIDAIIADILFTQKAHNHEVNQVIFGKEIDWLKSIKDRVHPQQKQDLSEKDKEIIKKIIESLQRYMPTDELSEEQEMIDWLKSLKPQKHWKPSDEQLNEVKEAIGVTGTNGIILLSLYNDLLKL